MTENNNTYKFTRENTFTEYPDLVTTDDMRAMLHIGKNKVYELINTKQIQTIRIGDKGRKHYVPKIEIIEYMNKSQKVS